MDTRSPRPSELSRRGIVTALGASAIPSHPARAANRHRFEVWLAERHHIESALDHTPEATAPLARERLFDRSLELERLILETPSDELPAIRIKAEVLTWLMEMESSDGLTAMREIHAFLLKLS